MREVVFILFVLPSFFSFLIGKNRYKAVETPLNKEINEKEMLNLNLLNYAVKDTNLSDSAFRMLYIIANNSSLKNSDSVNMHNGFLMDKLGKGERHIRRLTNELAKLGYLEKQVNSIGRKNLPNTYTLCADKNVPPTIYEANNNVQTCVPLCADKNVPP